MPMIAVTDPYLAHVTTDGPLMARARLDRATRIMDGVPSEDADQIALVHRWRGRVRLHHSPNEGQLAGDATARAKQASKRRAMGLSPGWPDLIFAEPVWVEGVKLSPFLVVELKKRNGVPSDLRDDQVEWLLHFRRLGVMAEWCRGFHEADRLLTLAYPGR